MKRVNKTIPILALLVLFAASGAAQQSASTTVQQPSVVSNNVLLIIQGKVINVHDGDTITVLDQSNEKFTIRLQGIDAPELKQEFGSASQKNLSRLVIGKQVTIVWTKEDKYGRTVGTIMLDGRDVNIEQVKAGMAWHFKKYEEEQKPEDRVTYAVAEQAARAAKLGLWVDPNPTPPGDWRADTKTARWGPEPPAGTIIGNTSSKKYHRPDCPGYRDMAERNRTFFKSVEEAEAAGFKRAGNCPAEIQTVSVKSSTVPATQPAPSVALSSIGSSTSVSTPATVADLPVANTQTVKPAPSVGLLSTGTSTSVSKPAASVADPPVAAATDSPSGKIVGNKNSKIFHVPGCSTYNSVSEKNRVYFDTAEDAEKAGFRKAKGCK